MINPSDQVVQNMVSYALKNKIGILKESIIIVSASRLPNKANDGHFYNIIIQISGNAQYGYHQLCNISGLLRNNKADPDYTMFKCRMQNQ